MKIKIPKTKLIIQNLKFARRQPRTNFKFRFVITDVFPQVLSIVYLRDEKVQC